MPRQVTFTVTPTFFNEIDNIQVNISFEAQVRSPARHAYRACLLAFVSQRYQPSSPELELFCSTAQCRLQGFTEEVYDALGGRVPSVSVS